MKAMFFYYGNKKTNGFYSILSSLPLFLFIIFILSFVFLFSTHYFFLSIINRNLEESNVNDFTNKFTKLKLKIVNDKKNNSISDDKRYMNTITNFSLFNKNNTNYDSDNSSFLSINRLKVYNTTSPNSSFMINNTQRNSNGIESEKNINKTITNNTRLETNITYNTSSLLANQSSNKLKYLVNSKKELISKVNSTTLKPNESTKAYAKNKTISILDITTNISNETNSKLDYLSLFPFQSILSQKTSHTSANNNNNIKVFLSIFQFKDYYPIFFLTITTIISFTAITSNHFYCYILNQRYSVPELSYYRRFIKLMYFNSYLSYFMFFLLGVDMTLITEFIHLLLGINSYSIITSDNLNYIILFLFFVLNIIFSFMSYLVIKAFPYNNNNFKSSCPSYFNNLENSNYSSGRPKFHSDCYNNDEKPYLKYKDYYEYSKEKSIDNLLEFYNNNELLCDGINKNNIKLNSDSACSNSTSNTNNSYITDIIQNYDRTSNLVLILSYIQFSVSNSLLNMKKTIYNIENSFKMFLNIINASLILTLCIGDFLKEDNQNSYVTGILIYCNILINISYNILYYFDLKIVTGNLNTLKCEELFLENNRFTQNKDRKDSWEKCFIV